jgi:small subunit ribosomal protein S4
MGDPKKPKKKYQTPNHPWKKERIEEERELTQEYGFANKKEIWKVGSILLDFKARAKNLISITGEKGNLERQSLINKLVKLGILKESATIDEVLSLTFRDIADRRLESLVFKRGLARTIKQARQFISHEHIKVAGRKINAPGYIVLKDEEDSISYSNDSSLNNENHPERNVVRKKDVVTIVAAETNNNNTTTETKVE